MSDPSEAAPAAQEATRWIEIVGVVVLGMAALLTAIAAYNAALKDGEALQGYSESTQLLSDANQQYAEAQQTFALDQGLFVQYAVAVTDNNTDVVRFLELQMRPELLAAIEWWQGNEPALTPFDEDPTNPYANVSQETAVDLEEQAIAKFEEGSKADEDGDQFELANVLFALALFFAGVGTIFRKENLQRAVIAVAAVAVVGGAIMLAIALF